MPFYQKLLLVLIPTIGLVVCVYLAAESYNFANMSRHERAAHRQCDTQSGRDAVDRYVENYQNRPVNQYTRGSAGYWCTGPEEGYWHIPLQLHLWNLPL